jgi:hypothetical protein
MSSITYNPNSASIALSSTKLDNVIKPMCLSKAEAKEARVQERVQAKEAKIQAKEAKVQAKEAKVQAKEANVQASLLAKEAKVQAKEANVQASLLAKEAKVQERLLAKEAKVQARVQSRLLAKEAKVQERLLAKEAKVQARLLAREAKLQSRLLKRVLAREAIKQAREAIKQERVQAREAIKQVREAIKQERVQARVQAREAIKQERVQAREAIKQERVQAREALRKRKERVKEIKRLYKIQARRTENILIMQRFAETHRLALDARAQLLLDERDMRRARRENGMDSSWVRDTDGNWVIRQTPVPVPVQARPQARPPRINPVRSYANQRGPARHQRVNARRMTAVNPVQELINKDKIECNKPHAELITKGTAIEVKDCPICLDELGNTNQMVLRCGHSFCGDCIMEHMPRVGGLKCPVCRAQYGVRINGWVPPTQVNNR